MSVYDETHKIFKEIMMLKSALTDVTHSITELKMKIDKPDTGSEG